jgi:hypothetical protein
MPDPSYDVLPHKSPLDASVVALSYSHLGLLLLDEREAFGGKTDGDDLSLHSAEFSNPQQGNARGT